MRADEALRILGLTAPATPAAIKAAYRERVKASHPDRFGADARRRAEAETELKRIIEAYQRLQRSEPAPDAATFTIHPMPASPRRRRRTASPGGTPISIRGLARRAAVPALELAVILVLWQAFALWLSKPSNGAPEPPLSLPSSTTPVAPRVRSRTPAVPSSARATLGDRAACYTPESSPDRYQVCLEARIRERRTFSRATTTAPDSTPEFRKMLCSSLQADFSQAAYTRCVAEVEARHRRGRRDDTAAGAAHR